MSNWVSVLILLILSMLTQNGHLLQSQVYNFFLYFLPPFVFAFFISFVCRIFIFQLCINTIHTPDTRHVLTKGAHLRAPRVFASQCFAAREKYPRLPPSKFFRTFLKTRMSTLIFYLFVFDIVHFISLSLTLLLFVSVLRPYTSIRFKSLPFSIFENCYN